MNRGQLVDRVRDMYMAFGSGDPDAYRSAFSDQIVWHVPGDNPVSGTYRGDEYFQTMPTRMAPLDDWRITVGDILTNERDRAALVRFHLVGARRGILISMDGYHVVRLDQDGRIGEGWGFTADQDRLDAFFRA